MSLQGDESLLAKIAEEHKTTVSERIYIDEGVSSYKGKNLESGQLGEIIKDIERSKIKKDDIIVMRALDRLSRQELTDSETLYNRIIGAGVHILTTIDNHLYKKNCVMSSVLKTLALNTAHEESAKKSYLTNRYALHRIEEFQRGVRPEQGTAFDVGVGKHPFWITLIDRVVHPHPVYMQAAKDIVRLIINGDGTRTVMKYLEQHYPERDWRYSSIARFYQMESLVGVLNLKLEEREYRLEQYYPRVCSDTDFQKMSIRKQQNFVASGNRKRTSILAGIRRLYCGCNLAMGAGVKLYENSSNPYYKCLHLMNPCIHYINQHVLDRIVLDAVQTHVFKTEEYDDTELQDLIAKCEIMRKKYAKQQNMLISDPDLFTPDFKERMRDAKYEIEQVESAIMRERKQHAVIDDVDLDSYQKWQSEIGEFALIDDDDARKEMRTRIQKVIRRITVDQQLVTIEIIDGSIFHRHIIKDKRHIVTYSKVHVVDADTLEMIKMTNDKLLQVYCLESDLERYKSACEIDEELLTRIRMRSITDHSLVFRDAIEKYLDSHEVLMWKRSAVMKLGLTTTQWQDFKSPETMKSTDITVREIQYKNKHYIKKRATVAYKSYNEQAIKDLLGAHSLISD